MLFAIHSSLPVLALRSPDGFSTLASVLSADRATWLASSKPLQGRASLLVGQVMTYLFSAKVPEYAFTIKTVRPSPGT